MTGFKYLKDRSLAITFWLIGLCILTMGLWLDPSRSLGLETLIYIDMLLSIFFLIYLIIDYFRLSRFYNELSAHQNSGEDALHWPLTKANSQEQETFQNYTNFLLTQHQNQQEAFTEASKDHREYIDSWVHEIKVPLAATKLLVETSEDRLTEDKFDQLENQIDKIQHYVEQVLYYSRLDAFSRDYLIQEYNLQPIIKDMIRDAAPAFIQKNIHFEIIGNDSSVLTDEKWLRFILDQLLNNSLKYTPKDGSIQIQTRQNEKGAYIDIIDSGIGIEQGDLHRIFDKGFTGQNGRLPNHRATGLGLYLAKNLAEKLGHELIVESTVGKGTTMTLYLPFLTYYNEQR